MRKAFVDVLFTILSIVLCECSFRCAKEPKQIAAACFVAAIRFSFISIKSQATGSLIS